MSEQRYVVEITRPVPPEKVEQVAQRIADRLELDRERIATLLDGRTGAVTKPVLGDKADAIAEVFAEAGVRVIVSSALREQRPYDEELGTLHPPASQTSAADELPFPVGRAGRGMRVGPGQGDQSEQGEPSERSEQSERSEHGTEPGARDTGTQDAAQGHATPSEPRESAPSERVDTAPQRVRPDAVQQPEPQDPAPRPGDDPTAPERRDPSPRSDQRAPFDGPERRAAVPPAERNARKPGPLDAVARSRRRADVPPWDPEVSWAFDTEFDQTFPGGSRAGRPASELFLEPDDDDELAFEESAAAAPAAAPPVEQRAVAENATEGGVADEDEDEVVLDQGDGPSSDVGRQRSAGGSSEPAPEPATDSSSTSDASAFYDASYEDIYDEEDDEADEEAEAEADRLGPPVARSRPHHDLRATRADPAGPESTATSAFQDPRSTSTRWEPSPHDPYAFAPEDAATTWGATRPSPMGPARTNPLEPSGAQSARPTRDGSGFYSPEVEERRAPKLRTYLLVALAVALVVLVVLQFVVGSRPPDASVVGAFDAGLEAYRKGEFTVARRVWEPLAESGHAQAQYLLGFMLQNGLGTPWTNAGAANWYRRAAQQGHPQAQLALGDLYLRGMGVGQDLAVGAAWYASAAVAGYPQAQFEYAQLLLHGVGVQQDFASARAWFEAAAANGVEEAADFVEYARVNAATVEASAE